MSIKAVNSSVRDARVFPFYRIFPPLVRDPLGAFEEVGRQADGEIIRLSLGAFRPYLITRPEHVQHVLLDRAANYRREGMMWKPLSRLLGQPSDADPAWMVKRGVYHSMLTGPTIASYVNDMAAAISEAVDELGQRAGPGQPIDAEAEMTRIVYRAIAKVFVGDRIAIAKIDEIGRAIVTATTSSFRARMLMPFVPLSIPLPGDRTFHSAIQAVDDLILPIVRESRRRGADGRDIVSKLLKARAENGSDLDDQQIRDGIVGLFVAATETTVTALTFLWMVLHSNPHIRNQIYDEVDRVVGSHRPERSHLSDLVYTKAVMLELLRVYSAAWVIPRTVAADDVIDGVRIKGGATVVISPYLTHRLPDVWPRPSYFDPTRFSPGRSRHRFAYMAFGAGPHQCVGRVFFTIEAQLVVAALVSRFRPVLNSSPLIKPVVGMTLKPRGRVELILQPMRRAGTFAGQS
jgi:cytochrome P450